MYSKIFTIKFDLICLASGWERTIILLLCPQSKVLYYPALKKIPQDAIVIEIAPTPLFVNMIKRTVGGAVTATSLMKKDQESNLEYFMNTMGQWVVFTSWIQWDSE